MALRSRQVQAAVSPRDWHTLPPARVVLRIGGGCGGRDGIKGGGVRKVHSVVVCIFYDEEDRGFSEHHLQSLEGTDVESPKAWIIWWKRLIKGSSMVK